MNWSLRLSLDGFRARPSFSELDTSSDVIVIDRKRVSFGLMLKLYARALAATDTQTVLQIATDVKAFYIQRAAVHRSMSSSAGVNGLLQWASCFASLGSLVQGSGPYGPVEALAFTNSVLVATAPEDAGARLRSQVAVFFSVSPFRCKIDHLIAEAPISPLALSALRLLITSIGQVCQGEAGRRTPFDPIVFALKTFGTATVLLIGLAIQHVIHRLFPIVPPPLTFMLIAYLITGHVNRIVTLGLDGWFDWAFTHVASHILAIQEPETPELPEDAVVPLDLVCPICRSLLANPVELLGSVICRGCMDRWIGTWADNHPVTGESVSFDFVTPSPAMRLVVQKYASMIVEGEHIVAE
jgi:hypothetical protein